MTPLLRIFAISLLVAFTPSLSADEGPVKEEKPIILPAIDMKAKAPKGVNKKLMSEDTEYGYSDQKPIRVGSKEEYGGPKAEQDYLDSLLDSKGKKIRYKRLFSGGDDAEGNPLDCYEVTISDGTKVQLWISMYHPKNKPDKQPAPVGFYKLRG